MRAFAVFKHFACLAPGAHHLRCINHFVAFFTDPFTEHTDHGLIHELNGIIFPGNVDAVFHGIQNMGQFLYTFHIGVVLYERVQCGCAVTLPK